MSKNSIVLEPSTNTHVMEGDARVLEVLPEMNGLVVETNGDCMILHGEHGLIVTENQNVVKLTQQEFNPLTKKIQEAYD